MRALLLAVFTLAACASQPVESPPPEPSAPAPVVERENLSPLALQIYDDLQRLDAELNAPGVAVAGFGELADLGGGLTVRPIATIEDSRCPGATQCLWEGRLRIRAFVSGRDTELTLGETTQTPHGAVEFAVASPGAWAEWPSDELGPRPAYRFGFRRD